MTATRAGPAHGRATTGGGDGAHHLQVERADLATPQAHDGHTITVLNMQSGHQHPASGHLHAAAQ